jgi:acetyl esterase/lipase
MSLMSREMRIILDAHLASAGADYADMEIDEAGHSVHRRLTSALRDSWQFILRRQWWFRTNTVNLSRQLVSHGVECRADFVPGVVHGFLQMTAKLPEAESALRTLSQVIRDRLDKAG